MISLDSSHIRSMYNSNVIVKEISSILETWNWKLNGDSVRGNWKYHSNNPKISVLIVVKNSFINWFVVSIGFAIFTIKLLLESNKYLWEKQFTSKMKVSTWTCRDPFVGGIKSWKERMSWVWEGKSNFWQTIYKMPVSWSYSLVLMEYRHSDRRVKCRGNQDSCLSPTASFCLDKVVIQ